MGQFGQFRKGAARLDTASNDSRHNGHRWHALGDNPSDCSRNDDRWHTLDTNPSDRYPAENFAVSSII